MFFSNGRGTVTVAAWGGIGALSCALLYDRRRYRRTPPNTWLEAYGGATCVLAVRHQGLPVAARLRLQVREADARLPHYPAPHDVHMETKAYGGSYRSVELSSDTDLAKATIARLSRASGDWYLYLPILGMNDEGYRVDSHKNITLVFDVTLFVADPIETVETTKHYQLVARQGGITVAEIADGAACWA